MSWAATAYIKNLRRAPNGEPITKGEKLVLIILSDYYHDEKGYAWPSLSRLADESLHSRRGVVLTLHALERKGLLCIVRSPDAVTKRVSNHYRFPGLKSLPHPLTGEASSLGLGKPVPHIFPINLSIDLSKDIGVGQMPATGLSSVPKKRRAEQPKGDAPYKAYAEGYLKRYGIEPVRNSKTNALMCQLIDRLGAEEAPLVAAFYLSVDTPLYVNARHPPNLLVRDCESLRTQWKTGPIRAPMVGSKAFQPVPKVETSPGECPQEAAEVLSRILGREAFSLLADRKGAA